MCSRFEGRKRSFAGTDVAVWNKRMEGAFFAADFTFTAMRYIVAPALIRIW
jgi:hypothetical protein